MPCARSTQCPIIFPTTETRIYSKFPGAGGPAPLPLGRGTAGLIRGVHVVRRKTCPDKGREGNGLFVSRRTEAPGHSTPARISTPQHAPWRPPLCMTCFDPLAIGWNRIHVSPGMGPAGDGLLGQQAKGRAGGRAGEPSRDSGPGPASRSPSAPRSAARGAAAESKGGSRESLENY